MDYTFLWIRTIEYFSVLGDCPLPASMGVEKATSKSEIFEPSRKLINWKMVLYVFRFTLGGRDESFELG